MKKNGTKRKIISIIYIIYDKLNQTENNKHKQNCVNTFFWFVFTNLVQI